MADELEMLEKQQLSAQRSLNDLTDQLTLADHLVYKKYLTELQNYGMVELSQQMLDVQDPAQCIQLFQLQKLTLKKGEDMFQKLSTVYYSSMAQGCSLAVMIDVPEENVGANIYLGVREDPLKKNMKSRDLDTSSKALQKVLSSNFPGSETRGIPRQEEKELLDGAFGDTQEAVASVSCVAALRDKSKTEDKAFVQGIERFMDAMDGEVYTALFLAEPVSAETQAEIRSGYENLIAFFGIGYGAYYATADMPIPMVADCSDYETYRSGNYIPGIMGTLFSLVDKLVSSLSATVVGIAVSFIGLESLPTQYDPYTPGMNWVVIVLFCIIPMVAWAATLIAMKGYTLTGEKMKEIQAVNACRRDAVANGMKLEEAMTKWQSMDQLPAEYRS